MENFEVKILQIRDHSYQIGYETGKSMRENPIVQILETITKPEINYKNMKGIYSSFAPHLLDELHGLSEALEISIQRAASLFSGYDVPKTEAMGCSAMITKDYYVRNYDFGPKLYDGLFSLVQPENTFATAGYNMQGLGRHDGVNEHGLTVGLHFVSNHNYSVGLSPWISIRMILDTCKTTDDAIQMLKELPHVACYNFSIGDKKEHIAVIEATPSNIIVRQDQELISCVNHFQDINLKMKNRPSIEGSIKRNDFIQSFRGSEFTQEEIFECFANKESPLFFNNYDELFGTLHTFSYAYKDEMIITAIARSKQTLKIDFKKWMEGNNIQQQILRGSIDS